MGGQTFNVPGIFTYSPPAGTVIVSGINPTLSVSFFPADTTDYAGVTATATVNVLPPPPPLQSYSTETTVTAKPASPSFGRPVILTARVKSRSRAGTAPRGSVTFLDGTVVLGTKRLGGGTASLRTSSLPIGLDAIQVVYSGSQNFSPGDSAAIIVTVRAHRSRTKATAIAPDGRVVRLAWLRGAETWLPRVRPGVGGS